jgi:hypothetical protein
MTEPAVTEPEAEPELEPRSEPHEPPPQGQSQRQNQHQCHHRHRHHRQGQSRRPLTKYRVQYLTIQECEQADFVVHGSPRWC